KQYYVPCNIVHKTKGRFQKIIIALLACLNSEGVSHSFEHCDYDSIIQEYEWHYKHGIDPDNPSEEDLEIKSIYENFKEGGKVDLLFKSLNKEKGSLDELKKLLKNYKPIGVVERNIISLIKRGIPLLEKVLFVLI
ncbi:MAG: hypothetical protein LIP01_02950, partial [Tannerellaceae bacterium]|nr:hypothetical protein [Tannerellaceae bacterium]